MKSITYKLANLSIIIPIFCFSYIPFGVCAEEKIDEKLAQECKDAAVRGANFLLTKREKLPPVWERQGGYMFVASSDVIEALISVYSLTSDKQYITPIKESVDFLVGMEEELLKMGFKGKPNTSSQPEDKKVQKEGYYAGWKPGTQRGPPPDYLRGSPDKDESFYQRMSEITKRVCLAKISLQYYNLTKSEGFPKEESSNTSGFKNLDLKDYIKEVDYLGCAKRMGDWFVDHQDYRGVWGTDPPFQAQITYLLLDLYKVTKDEKYLKAVKNIKPRLVEIAEFKIEKCVASASSTGYVGLLTPGGEKGDTLSAAKKVADWFVKLQSPEGSVGLPNHPGGILYSDYMNAEWVVKELLTTFHLAQEAKYQKTALKCVKWVLATQGSDGAWGTEGDEKRFFKTSQSIRTLCYIASYGKTEKKGGK